MKREDPRRRLGDLLSRYDPWDDEDRRQWLRIRSFAESTPPCFQRSNLAGHITGSAWLVDPSRERVLLTRHKKLDKWLQLGGHADGEPDILAVALREAREESGLSDIRSFSSEIFDLDVHPIPATGSEPAHFHYDIRFALQAGASGPLKAGRESHDLAWVRFEDLPKFTREPSLLRMREKWLALRLLRK